MHKRATILLFDLVRNFVIYLVLESPGIRLCSLLFFPILNKIAELRGDVGGKCYEKGDNEMSEKCLVCHKEGAKSFPIFPIKKIERNNLNDWVPFNFPLFCNECMDAIRRMGISGSLEEKMVLLPLPNTISGKNV